ncbi:sigma-70 family RNA polymerase sigma factor [Chitinophaga sp. OAE865]|uniref:RNA polymerase sigma factor n=1 Tax=Chitinophaga sp. OAE865 TaxID=2817898 RepID=UPI001AE3D373
MLLANIAEGDEQAFASVFQSYYKELFHFLYKYTDSEQEREEIIQETFIRVWLNRDRLPEIVHFRAWLYKVAAREFLLFLRKKLQYGRVMEQHLKVPLSLVHTPQEETQLNEVQRLVNEAIMQQPPQRRRIYQMSRHEGMKIPDIAAALSISVNTVKNSLTTTLRQIREHLARQGYFVSLLAILFFF